MANDTTSKGSERRSASPDQRAATDAKAKDGGRLEEKQKRNSDMTEKMMRDPNGGAHSDTPDPSNP